MRQVIILASCCVAAFAMTAAAAGAANYRHHHYYNHWAARHGYHGGSYLADPGLTPNPLLDFYRRYHICAIDEGYGRATRCD